MRGLLRITIPKLSLECASFRSWPNQKGLFALFPLSYVILKQTKQKGQKKCLKANFIEAVSKKKPIWKNKNFTMTTQCISLEKKHMLIRFYTFSKQSKDTLRENASYKENLNIWKICFKYFKRNIEMELNNKVRKIKVKISCYNSCNNFNPLKMIQVCFLKNTHCYLKREFL